MDRLSFSGARRTALAANLALVLAVSGIVGYAISAQGFRSHRTELNDGGVWITSNKESSFGRINKPIAQQDGAVFGKLGASLDVLQDGNAVVGVNVGSASLTVLDPAYMKLATSGANLPAGAATDLRGGSLGVLDPQDGSLWGARVDPKAGNPDLSAVSHDSPPLAKVGAGAALAVTTAGTLVGVSSADDSVTQIAINASGSGFGAAVKAKAGVSLGADLAVTAVGEQVVVLDRQANTVRIIGGPSAKVPAGFVLQQPGPASDAVLGSTPDGVESISLADGSLTVLGHVTGTTGSPAAPVSLGGCAYAAWPGPVAQALTECGGRPATPMQLGAAATDLKFRVNWGQILLNDLVTGATWDVDHKPLRVDNWKSFLPQQKQDQHQNQHHTQSHDDRSAPKAVDDEAGARPGRTTILYPLDNDQAPAGSIMVIHNVTVQTGSKARAVISPDGQTIQFDLPAGASGDTRLTYQVDNGVSPKFGQATITVHTRDLPLNAPPAERPGLKPQTWSVAPGQTIDLPVLPDWRDKHDGDALSVTTAHVLGGRGGQASVTAAGRVRFVASDQPGLTQVAYGVTDGLSAPVTGTLTFKVLSKDAVDPVPPTAEPDIATGEVGKPITITPLGNDEPGADPLIPNASLALGGKVDSIDGADVSTDLVNGTVTVNSDKAQTLFLNYTAAYGGGQAQGRIRVDVQPGQGDHQRPIAVPDNVTLFGQAPALVDVLANDYDPNGGLLSVVNVNPVENNQVDVGVVQGRWVKITARQAALSPNPQIVKYTISNGTDQSVTGQIVVRQEPAPQDDSPVTTTDRVTVRAGSTSAIPVLDNDYAPDGSPLGLGTSVSDGPAGALPTNVAGGTGDAGKAYVSGRVVRYVAPASVKGSTQMIVHYSAQNLRGDQSDGRVVVTVVPASKDNHPPDPPTLEGRVTPGGQVTLKLPPSGVDPDGDPVSITGIDVQDLAGLPQMGRITSFGANAIQYQAYPDQGGTDTFHYLVTDSLGATATGTARVVITDPGAPQPPVAINDDITVAPGATAVVDALGNDLVAAGDVATLKLAHPAPGVVLKGPFGPVTIQAPSTATAEVTQVVYTLTDGLQQSTGTITVHVEKGFNNPPIVPDVTGSATNGDLVTADVLAHAWDPDDPTNQLHVVSVTTPPGTPPARIAGSKVTVQRGPAPLAVPFTVEDKDGGIAAAVLYVPAADGNVPYVKTGAVANLKVGETKSFNLSTYVTNPSSGTLRFAPRQQIWGTPSNGLSASITGDNTFKLTAKPGYEGFASVVFNVQTVTSGTAAAGPRTTTLTLNVQIGQDRPVLRCPQTVLPISQDGAIDLNVTAVCATSASDPNVVPLLQYKGVVSPANAGVTVSSIPGGGSLHVAAAPGAKPGTQVTLTVTTRNSLPGTLRLVVVKAPPPSLSAITFPGLNTGQAKTLDLAQFMRPGIAHPQPTLLKVTQTTKLDIAAQAHGSQLTLSAGSTAFGHATFQVVMSDAGPNAGPERQVSGLVQVDVLAAPAVPTGLTRLDGLGEAPGTTRLTWNRPDDHGSPIQQYQVIADAEGHGSSTHVCRSVPCQINGLSLTSNYRFRVRAINAVGASDWSTWLGGVSLDSNPGSPDALNAVPIAANTVHVTWKPPANVSGGSSSSVAYYLVRAGHQTQRVPGDKTALDLTGITGGVSTQITVRAVNLSGLGSFPATTSVVGVGEPSAPGRPVITTGQMANGQGNIHIAWNRTARVNGPDELVYVLNVQTGSGTVSHRCSMTRVPSCDLSGIKLDGTNYTFWATAYNNSGQPFTLHTDGPQATWRATAAPDAWDANSIVSTPTGNDGEADLRFTVPASNGPQSSVSILENGNTIFGPRDLTGTRTATINVGSDTGHDVVLQVCNGLSSSCSRTTTHVETYGPLGGPAAGDYILSMVPNSGSGDHAGDVTWTIWVNPNGNRNVQVIVDPSAPGCPTPGSCQRQVLTAQVPATNPPGAVPVTTDPIPVGWNTRSWINVTLLDPDMPDRKSQKEQSDVFTTPDTPTGNVRVYKGASCEDPANGSTPSGPACNANPPCTDDACGHLMIDVSNWLGPVTCSIEQNFASVTWRALGQDQTFNAGGTYDTGYIEDSGSYRATCSAPDGYGGQQQSTSDTFDWP